MTEHNGGNGGTVLAAFVLGAITGAALALLWTPVAGEEARRVVGEKARDGREKAGDALGKGRDYVKRQREHVEAAVERGRQAYRQARQPKEPA